MIVPVFSRMLFVTHDFNALYVKFKNTGVKSLNQRD